MKDFIAITGTVTLLSFVLFALAAEALRIVFPNGTWVDAQELAKQGVA